MQLFSYFLFLTVAIPITALPAGTVEPRDAPAQPETKLPNSIIALEAAQKRVDATALAVSTIHFGPTLSELTEAQNEILKTHYAALDALDRAQFLVATDPEAPADLRKEMAVAATEKVAYLIKNDRSKMAALKESLNNPTIDAVTKHYNQGSIDRYTALLPHLESEYANLMGPICKVNPEIEGCKGGVAVS
ncbi:MAG: hypothetical protein M1829_005475 [Trizodia sp. TS-e1964]|nr:MAG: hypothetical protein M1829_005475 [Trizodia sp. TS-e1964]